MPKFEVYERRAWSFQFNQCFCQSYDLNSATPISEMKECALSKCDDIVGFAAKDWAEGITPKAKEILRYGKDNCE